MKLLTSAQMKQLDSSAIDGLGIPSTLLMTNAARCIAEAALDFIGDGGSAAILCGSGNNGGDGVAAALFLLKRGAAVRAFLVGSRGHMTADTLEMERRLIEAGGLLEAFDPGSGDINNYIKSCTVIIDALFGVGLNRDVSGTALSAIRIMNGAPAPVVSADIPSGVEADTGRILGEAVRASVTVTFTFAKPGHIVAPGCAMCGTLKICDIGIPEALSIAAETDIYAITGEGVALPRRETVSHKGDYGKDLIIAGSVGYTGAPVLASRAAVRSGAGLVFLGVPEKIYDIAAVKCDEAMPFPLPCDDSGIISEGALDIILGKLKNCDVCLVGPGLGRSKSATEIVHSIIKNSNTPIVVDADGINAVSENIDILHKVKCPIVLTPHDGEFTRMGGDLRSYDRITAAQRFAVEYGCVLVLKGPGTITASPDGLVFVNTTGNPGMAKGGSGDILSGMITALVGEGLLPLQAAVYAVYLHGKAGDLCAEALGEYAMTPTDIIQTLPTVFKNQTR
ncbi:MAG: NAD(P)H-hydrate dehydratase [Oscillospiraceae bacterium]